jgi:ribosome maturation factor RimP
LNRREDQIEALLTPTVEALGCEVWGLEYLSQGRRAKLRIYIERPEGVTVEDCERVSREVSDLLDVEDVIPAAYTLEVSSPGMDRILFKEAHYQANVGATVDVRLNFPFEGRKHIVGVLAGCENGEAIVRPLDAEVRPLDAGVRPLDAGVRPLDAGVRPPGAEGCAEDAEGGDGGEYLLPLENIQRARLIPQFD